jgi:hypothetical protein
MVHTILFINKLKFICFKKKKKKKFILTLAKQNKISLKNFFI